MFPLPTIGSERPCFELPAPVYQSVSCGEEKPTCSPSSIRCRTEKDVCNSQEWCVDSTQNLRDAVANNYGSQSG